MLVTGTLGYLGSCCYCVICIGGTVLSSGVALSSVGVSTVRGYSGQLQKG